MFSLIFLCGLEKFVGVDFIRSAVSPVMEEHYPSRANHEEISLYDL
jgi:hypothetical protein